jgi:anti-sigma regulatory factor (Ser/Thr protein kinase)
VIVQRTYPGKPASVPKARHFIASALHGLPEPVQEVVGLMVSELATNAVRHTGSSFTIHVEVAHGTVRVEVTDPGPGEPVKRSPRPTDPNGRGLRIVETLATEWGVLPVSPRGKTVWFSVPLNVPPAAAKTS